MNTLMFFHYCLKRLRVIYKHVFPNHIVHLLPCTDDPDKASADIYKLLTEDKPCMIARFGGTEITCLFNYLSVNSSKHSLKKYLRRECSEWWWNQNGIEEMKAWSGFFPIDIEHINKFCQLMLEDTEELDLLGSWLVEEQFISPHIHQIPRHSLLCIEPYWAKNPWTKALEGKRVLVIHPFAKSIEQQYYTNRTFLFDNSNVLPLFDLQTIKAVQSLGGESDDFKTWFEALQWMKDEIDKRDYDICLIGCGAYGFPLAAHVKRQGKKAVHLGGALQILFGIRGNRWDNPAYNSRFDYTKLFNPFWIRPNTLERPTVASSVDGGCYW